VSDDITEVRRMVTDTHTLLVLHDAKVDSNVARIAESQERIGAAIEKIGDATMAIQTLASQLQAKSNGKNGILPDKRLWVPLLAVLLMASFVAGGGAELMRALLEALKK